MSALPRAAWLASGAIVAALGGPGAALDMGLPAAAVLLLMVPTALAVVALARRGRMATAALLLGLGTVSLRVVLPLLIGGAGGGDLALPAGSGQWQARVVELSSPSGAEQRGFLRVSAGPGQEGEWLVYAWLPRHPALVPGDEVSLRGTLQAAPLDAPGFADFLASRGAAGTLKAHSLELSLRGSDISAMVEQLRRGIDAALSRSLPEPEAGLASGILIGLRERVSRAVAEEFTITGLTHVVAISGWNIALVAGIATGLMRATGLPRRPRSCIVIIAIIGYTVLAGAEASVIRAAVMGGVVLVAREGGRPSGATAALGLACWGLLLVDPRMIGDIGFQLSLAATAGLLALGGRAESLVRRLTAGRAPRWFCETLGVSLAAQLSTLPLILLHFGRLSLISPLANLLVAPVVPLAMLGAAIGTLLGPLLVGPPASLLLAPLTVLAWLPLAAMVRGADLLADVPFASLGLPAPLGLAGAGLSLLGLVAALRAARNGPAGRSGRPERSPAALVSSDQASTVPPRRAPRVRRGAAVGVVVVFCAVGASVLVARPQHHLQVTVLDIGQGDAILVEASGVRMLVDGGPDPDLLVGRLDERIPLWDRRIDLVVLTHPHEDHAGGLAGLAPRYSVGRIAETGMTSEGSGVRGLRAIAANLGIGRLRMVQGHAFMLGSARVEVLWPPLERLPASAPSSGRAINDTSIVLAVSVGRQRVLLTGDLEEDRDADLLEVLPRDGRRWDLLKVAHHGSATASSRLLLEALSPRLAAISSGAGNDYGHPAPATLERLTGVGATVWRTDRQGSLSVALDGGSASAATLLAGRRMATACPSAAGAAAAKDPLPQATARGACYARPDGGPHPSRSPVTARVHGTLTTLAAARHGRRRSGRVPGRTGGPGRPWRGPAPGRDCRGPPRRRQGFAARPSHPGAGAWPGRRRLGQRGRTPRAGACDRGTSGDALA